jgi:hypothetical protein
MLFVFWAFIVAEFGRVVRIQGTGITPTWSAADL